MTGRRNGRARAEALGQELEALTSRHRQRLTALRQAVDERRAEMGLEPGPAAPALQEASSGSDDVAAGAKIGGSCDPGASGRGRVRIVAVTLLVAGAGVAAWGSFVAVRLVDAAGQVRLGTASIEAAKGSITTGGALSTDVTEQLARASGHFRTARRDLSGPVVGAAAWLPVVGTQVSSVSTLTGAAGAATDTGRGALAELRSAMAVDSKGGSGRVGLLRRVATTSASTRAALDRVHLGPSFPLLPAIAGRRTKLVDDLHQVEADLRRAQLGAGSLADLLQGPHRYLLLTANNAEMRSGSGMFLEAGLLETDNGEVQLGAMQSTGDLGLPPGAVVPAGDLEQRWGWLEPGSEWRNLAVSPRFPPTAALAAQMWMARQGGPPVDGVIVVDPAALAALLDGAGPISVGGTTLNSSDVTSFLLRDQYLGALGAPDAPGRIDALGTLAQSAMARLTAGGDMTRLSAGLARAVAGRHILVWSADPATERAWSAAGAAGDLGSRSLLAAVENVGGNKLDPFLSVDASLDHRAQGNRTVFTLKINVANRTPAGLPPYVAGPASGTGATAGEYLGLVAVNLPGDAQQARVLGHAELPVAGRDGPTLVLATPVRLLAGQSGAVVITFDEPNTHGRLTLEPSARIPAIRWHASGMTLSDTAAHMVSW